MRLSRFVVIFKAITS